MRKGETPPKLSDLDLFHKFRIIYFELIRRENEKKKIEFAIYQNQSPF